MIKISDALEDLVQSNPFLMHGLHHKLLNLSQVARFVQPLIAARINKEVQTSALLMSLSRLQTRFASSNKAKAIAFHVDNITVQSDLAIMTVEKSRESHRKVGSIYTRIQNAGGYITITEGLSEITIILDRDFLPIAQEALDKIAFKSSSVAALSVKFSEKYLRTPGFFFAIFESLAFQGINIVELASTTTELIFYLAPEDVQLAFDTLYNKFRKK